MKKLVVFGTGDFADTVCFMLEKKLGRQIEAYTVNEKYITAQTYKGKPLVAFEHLQEIYPPEEYDAVMGMIGKQMFNQREAVFNQLREAGYHFPNVIHPTAAVDTEQIGEGNIIFANTSIEAHCQIGSCNIVWQNVAMGHHNRVGNYNNFAAGVILGGYSCVGNHCFVGINSCVKNRIEIPDYSFIGAGAYVAKPIDSYKIIVPPRSYELAGKTGFDYL